MDSSPLGVGCPGCFARQYRTEAEVETEISAGYPVKGGDDEGGGRRRTEGGGNPMPGLELPSGRDFYYHIHQGWSASVGMFQ